MARKTHSGRNDPEIMGNSAKRDARTAERLALQRRALEIRLSGANHDAIAKQIGVANRSVAWKLVQDALHEIIREPAEGVLELELARLDEMLLGCWEKARTGDASAIDRALRIMDRRARYLGLDAPSRAEVTGASGAPIVLNVSSLNDEQLRIAAADDALDESGATGGSAGGTGEAGEAE